MLDTVMFFWGIPQVNLPLLNTVYDVAIAFMALILLCLYVTGSIKDAANLAKLDE